MARGGRRTPASPAPVSGPGALSRRTDGGASAPIQVPATGLRHGQAGELQDQIDAVGTPAPGGTPAVPPPGGAAPSDPGAGIFGPTAQPNVSPLAGISPEQQSLEADPDEFARMLYALHPHPDIARLLDPHRGI